MLGYEEGRFDVSELIQLFDNTFFEKYNTRLVRGGDEPLYLPAGKETDYAQIIFAHGYFSSALHEIAHWCIAGPERRKQVDYGYWYAPDGRNAEQQAKFEAVEVLPQAIEWAYCLACGLKFNVSIDNLNGEQGDVLAFKSSVAYKLSQLLTHGFPERAEMFLEVLRMHYFPACISKPLTRAQRLYANSVETSFT
ncbi:elongation factor P hydroxylase [Opacimonas viscosa]|uniref:Elongation factor P hydroxylase n=1 Tax=Opacimonas viscosa TaxID=2961944 RepID=A0AA42BKQ4_9ALTE|nr:elongation factor P hydroxylase [Opacimonas viscosa]MCP3428033.1 elongation factor P hydroxylase [Opacimonas viscosa]